MLVQLKKYREDKKYSHKSSRYGCLLAHYSEQGDILGPCIQCSICNKYIRPEKMREKCLGIKEGK